MGSRILFLLLQRIGISDHYLSIEKPGEGLYKEKGSKFRGFVFPVNSIEKAKEKIQELRTLHPKAVHVCFAWRLGLSNYEDRYSDDGEPNNSAGKPIFGQIVAAEITNVCVAVVRYYGGTKLGVGGLINAYKTAAKEAISSTKIIEKFETVGAIIKFDPSHTGHLMSMLNKMNASIDVHGFEGQLHTVRVELKKTASNQIFSTFESLPQYQIEPIK